MPTPHVIQLADGTHFRVPPPGHPNRDEWCHGQMAAARFTGKAAAELVIKQRNLKGATAVPYFYQHY